jgi:hypothetical protein
VPAVFADDPAATTTPSSVGTNGVVTITITDNVAFSVTGITVTGPDGTVYTSTVCVGLLPCHGDSSNPVAGNFGTGQPGWVVTTVGSGCAGYPTPALGDPANTACPGMYTVAVAGLALSTSPRFHVSASFGVPEFGFPAIMIAALGMVFIAGLRSRSSGRRITAQ